MENKPLYAETLWPESDPHPKPFWPKNLKLYLFQFFKICFALMGIRQRLGLSTPKKPEKLARDGAGKSVLNT